MTARGEKMKAGLEFLQNLLYIKKGSHNMNPAGGPEKGLPHTPGSKEGK